LVLRISVEVAARMQEYRRDYQHGHDLDENIVVAKKKLEKAEVDTSM